VAARIPVKEGNDRSAAIESVDMFVTPGCVTITSQVSSNLERKRRATWRFPWRTRVERKITGERSNGEGLSRERKEPRFHHSNLGTGSRFGQKSERAPKFGGPPGLMFEAL
jgi:hypothetical protein